MGRKQFGPFLPHLGVPLQYLGVPPCVALVLSRCSASQCAHLQRSYLCRQSKLNGSSPGKTKLEAAHWGAMWTILSSMGKYGNKTYWPFILKSSSTVLGTSAEECTILETATVLHTHTHTHQELKAKKVKRSLVLLLDFYLRQCCFWHSCMARNLYLYWNDTDF